MFIQNNDISIHPAMNVRKQHGQKIKFTTATKGVRNIETLMSNFPVLGRDDYLA